MVDLDVELINMPSNKNEWIFECSIALIGICIEYDKWTREKRKVYSEKYKATLSMDKMSTKNNCLSNEIIFNRQTKGLNQTICLDNIHEILIEEFVVISKDNNNPRTKLLLDNLFNE